MTEHYPQKKLYSIAHRNHLLRSILINPFINLPINSNKYWMQRWQAYERSNEREDKASSYFPKQYWGRLLKR